MCHKTAFHTSLSLSLVFHWLAQVGFRAGYLIEVKRNSVDEMIFSYNRPANYDGYKSI
jgi:hypothetical protein